MLPPIARGQQEVGLLDSPDAVGDVHDASAAGGTASDHDDRDAYPEVALPKDNGPQDDNRVSGIVASDVSKRDGAKQPRDTSLPWKSVARRISFLIYVS